MHELPAPGTAEIGSLFPGEITPDDARMALNSLRETLIDRGVDLDEALSDHPIRNFLSNTGFIDQEVTPVVGAFFINNFLSFDFRNRSLAFLSDRASNVKYFASYSDTPEGRLAEPYIYIDFGGRPRPTPDQLNRLYQNPIGREIIVDFGKRTKRQILDRFGTVISEYRPG